MEFKRFKRKGIIFNNNSVGLGLELRIKKKIKVFRIERLSKENNVFEYLIYDGASLVDDSLNKEIASFLEANSSKYSFFDGELKTWNKIS
ncbi:MAG: hypothetical protein P8Q16_02555 [Flavobacteriales bacterium]|jgi:hypothetical protein|nr:hypothetical protein [Flavobacteriales bacterium]MDG1439619.1 hypothetical protein [Flavobacteriales bacterium]MDG1797927.1 hypothetical protein [Flavobacteriales bacterium]|tara:strand:+ start:277 stop:546 length:270 start_codon:yes stop_codon:yes gene_type:complete